MKPQHFLKELKHDDIVAAIKAAERNTSGEIRIFVSHQRPADIMAVAREQFQKLGMTCTHHRNGVLIYVAPAARQFAIIGDTGVHRHCGDTFWKEVADEMSGHFRAGDFSAGIIHGIQKAGALLAAHFPPGPQDGNELSDEIAHD